MEWRWRWRWKLTKRGRLHPSTEHLQKHFHWKICLSQRYCDILLKHQHSWSRYSINYKRLKIFAAAKMGDCIRTKSVRGENCLWFYLVSNEFWHMAWDWMIGTLASSYYIRHRCAHASEKWVEARNMQTTVNNVEEDVHSAVSKRGTSLAKRHGYNKHRVWSEENIAWDKDWQKK